MKPLAHLALLLLALSIAPIIRADVISYWTFDGGTPPDPAGTVATEVNTPTLDGSAIGYSGGLPPVYDLNIPGQALENGTSGGRFSNDNAASLQFINGGVPGDLNSQTGGKINVTDPGDATLKLTSFTVEAFIRVDIAVNYSTIVSKNRADAGGSTWMLDTTNDGRLRARFDSQTLGSGSGAGFNQSFTAAPGTTIADGAWHHVALTYDGGTGIARLFLDYQDVAGGTVSNPLVYDDSNLTIGQGGGGRAFDGWMDEVRISDTVLATGEFLHIAKLKFDIATDGLDLVFTFPSRSGKIYDILSSTDLSTPPASWTEVYAADIAATPPTNTYTDTRPNDPTMFFVLVERDAPADPR